MHNLKRTTNSMTPIKIERAPKERERKLSKTLANHKRVGKYWIEDNAHWVVLEKNYYFPCTSNTKSRETVKEMLEALSMVQHGVHLGIPIKL
jgi:hypothetical protein